MFVFIFENFLFFFWFTFPNLKKILKMTRISEWSVYWHWERRERVFSHLDFGREHSLWTLKALEELFYIWSSECSPFHVYMLLKPEQGDGTLSKALHFWSQSLLPVCGLLRCRYWCLAFYSRFKQHNWYRMLMFNKH